MLSCRTWLSGKTELLSGQAPFWLCSQVDKTKGTISAGLWRNRTQEAAAPGGAEAGARAETTAGSRPSMGIRIGSAKTT